MVSPRQRARWKNISYGASMLTAPETLYWDPDPDASP